MNSLGFQCSNACIKRIRWIGRHRRLCTTYSDIYVPMFKILRFFCNPVFTDYVFGLSSRVTLQNFMSTTDLLEYSLLQGALPQVIHWKASVLVLFPLNLNHLCLREYSIPIYWMHESICQLSGVWLAHPLPRDIQRD